MFYFKGDENEAHVLNEDAWELFVNLLEENFQFHIDECKQSEDKLASLKKLRFCLAFALNTVKFYKFYRCRVNIDRFVFT